MAYIIYLVRYITSYQLYEVWKGCPIWIDSYGNLNFVCKYTQFHMLIVKFIGPI